MKDQEYYFVGTGKNLAKIPILFRTSKTALRASAILPKPEIVKYLKKIETIGKPCVFGFWYDASEKALIFEKTLLHKTINPEKYPNEKCFYKAIITGLYETRQDAILNFIRFHGRSGGTFVYNSVKHTFYLVGIHNGTEVLNPCYTA